MIKNKLCWRLTVELKKYKALYEKHWYTVTKIDYDYEVVYIRTGNGSARIHVCYIDELKEVKNEKI